MKYDLVLAGGGAKGIVHCGALRALEARGHGHRRLVGVSAGAITALFLAAGFSADDILAAISEKNAEGEIILADFLDVPEDFDSEALENSVIRNWLDELHLPFLTHRSSERVKRAILTWLMNRASFRKIFSFIQYGGIYTGERFLSWLRQKLDEREPGLGWATLAEFHQQTGADFTAITADTTDSVMLQLNHRTAPDLPVAWAVRMSMSLPFIYQEVIWRKEWGQYDGRDITGHAMVDGGVSSNLPIDLLLSREPELVRIMGGKPDPGRVIGLYIDASIPVPGADQFPPKTQPAEQRIQPGEQWQPLVDRVSRLINTTIRSRDNLEIRLHPNNVCHLPAGGYDTMEFDMSDERMELLVQAGQMAMESFLDKQAIRRKSRWTILQRTRS
jgi:predicted acylesterase/phospholipase RssA